MENPDVLQRRLAEITEEERRVETQRRLELDKKHVEKKLDKLSEMGARLQIGYVASTREGLRDLHQEEEIWQNVMEVTIDSRKAIVDDHDTNRRLLALGVTPEELVQTKQLTFLFDAHKGKSGEIDYLLDMKTLLKRADPGFKLTEARVRAQFLAALGFQEGRFGFPVNTKEAERRFQMIEDWSDTEHGWLTYCVYGYYAQYGLASFTKGETNAQNGYIQYKDRYIPIAYLWVTDRYENRDTATDQILAQKALASYAVAISNCFKAGFVPAIAFLGMRYLTDGWCVTPDREEGLRLLKIAADQGDGPSRLHLGEVYSKGLYGITPDITEAQKWYLLAKEQNMPGAREALKQINPSSSKCVVM